MSPDRFRDRVLGPWSSHPRWVRWRRWWFSLAAFAPLVLVVVFGALAVRFAGLQALLREDPRWLTAVGMAGALGVAAAVTLAIVARLAEWRAAGRVRQFQEAAAAPLDPWIVLVALVLGAVGPYVMSQWTVLPSSVRLGFRLFAIFPLVGLLLGLRVLERPSQRDEETGRPSSQDTRRRPLLLVLLMVAIAVLAITVAHDLGILLNRPAWSAWAAGWLPWYAAAGQPLLGVLVLVPVAYLLFACWLLWPAKVREAIAPGPATETERGRKPLWRRLADWVRWLFGLARSAAVTGGPIPPRWLSQLQQHFHQDAAPVELIQLPDSQTSPPSPHVEFRHLFGVERPTVDQVDVLDRFRALYRRVLDDTEAVAESCPDLLVLGDPGAGKTTALVACAAYAAFVRGERVLFVVPDALRQEAVEHRLKDFLRAVRLAPYVSAGSLSKEAVDRWLHGIEPVPDILLGTVQSVEEHLFGHFCTQEQLPRLRRLALLPEVVVVDDFMDFDDAPRSHLCFLLDKHRLLLSAEYIQAQVVVSCRRLTDLGTEVLGRRLSTVKGFDKTRNVVVMKPRQGARAWRVRMQAEDPASTIESMVLWCLERDLDVVLYRAGIDEDERTRQEAHLEGAARGGSGRLAVISDLERPLAEPVPVEVDAIFYQEALHEDICLALRLHAGNDDTVVFSIEPTGARHEAVLGIAPVVADRTATPFLAAHLESILRFLRPHVPVHGDLWSRFGVDYRGLPQTPEGAELAEPRLTLDLWEEEDYGTVLWPYLWLSVPATSRAPVHALSLPNVRWTFCRSDESADIVMARISAEGRPAASASTADVGGDRRRYARWYDEQAVFDEFGDVDLAHAYQYRLLWGRRSIGLRTIEQADDGGVRLISDLWHGDGVDRYLPVWDVAWTVAEGLRGSKFWGSVEDGLRWCELNVPGDDAVIEARILGQMAENAQVSDFAPVCFAYPAELSVLVLGPKRLERPSADMGAFLRGRWGTGEDRRFWPALTGAMNYALRVRLPGLHYFSRILAFRPAGEVAAIGRAVVWLIEPSGSGRTAGRTLASLLSHPHDRDHLLASAEWLLEQLGDATPPTRRALRQMTRIGWAGDERLEGIEEARGLVAEVRALGAQK